MDHSEYPRTDEPEGSPAEPVPELVRLNKYLADRGVASRRRCDELIAGGHVSVDGDIVTEMGVRVDPMRTRVEVDGTYLEPGLGRRYYLLNKPRGVVCTNELREARPRAIDLIRDPDKGRIYTVGRLDEDSEGLILLTSDGEFAQRVSHPRYGVRKTYLVKLRGRVETEAVERIRGGVHLAEGRTGRALARVIKRTSQFSLLEVTLSEGKNREVRRVFAQVGFKVQSLKRVRIGNLSDRRLKPGQWRPLLRAEVRELLTLTEPGSGGEPKEGDAGAGAGARIYSPKQAPGKWPKRGGAAGRKPLPRGQRFGPRAAQNWTRKNQDRSESGNNSGYGRPR